MNRFVHLALSLTDSYQPALYTSMQTDSKFAFFGNPAGFGSGNFFSAPGVVRLNVLEGVPMEFDWTSTTKTEGPLLRP